MITLHDWIGEKKNLLTEFEQWWQENHGRVRSSFQLRWTKVIGSNSLRSSVSSERAPLEEVRWGTRTRSDYHVGTDFALGWAFSATVPERVRTVAGSAAVTIRRTVVAACGAILGRRFGGSRSPIVSANVPTQPPRVGARTVAKRF